MLDGSMIRSRIFHAEFLSSLYRKCTFLCCTSQRLVFYLFLIDLISLSKIKEYRLHIPNIFCFRLFVFNIFDVQTNNAFRNISDV